jgi:Putative metal-binding motif
VKKGTVLLHEYKKIMGRSRMKQGVNRILFGFIGILAMLLVGCDSSAPSSGNPWDGGGGGKDGSAGDSDSDTDSDVDTDADSDADSDLDTDADSDSDTDHDAGKKDGGGSACDDLDSDDWCQDFDCNDSDSMINPDADEIMDSGVDEDCDGLTDEAPLGDAGADTKESMGPGTDKEYFPGDDNSDGVGTNDDGWLILSDSKVALNALWVSNSADGTVSKIDTEEVLEVGRFYVGLGAGNPDPSRTSVDLAGDVFVANRSKNYGGVVASSVTKIAAKDIRCVDRNSNGTYETSTGPTPYPRSTGGNVPAGQSIDECVVWTRGFDSSTPNHIDNTYGCYGMRAVAATAETGDNFEYNGHVWVGCHGDDNASLGGRRAVYKLNGTTGNMMQEYQMTQCHPYGYALDRDGRLWVSSRNAFGYPTDWGTVWVDTTTGAEHWMPQPTDSDFNPYGIAIDDGGNIWMSDMAGNIYRYTPGPTADLDTGIWEWMKVPGADSFRGIAVDKDGFVWVIDTSGKAVVHLVDSSQFPNAISYLGEFYLGDDDVVGGTHDAQNGTGVAVDFNDHVWGVSRNPGRPSGYATRLEVERGGAAPKVIHKDIIEVGGEPYVYSDMIGYNLRHFATDEGWYRQIFEVCPGHSTRWDAIEWEAVVPQPETHVIIRARTADYIADLDTATWQTIVEIPPDMSPVVLPTMPEGHYIQLEVRLYTDSSDITPKVGPISFTYKCTSVIS